MSPAHSFLANSESTSKEFSLITLSHFSRGATVATRKQSTNKNMSRHLVEIGNDVVAAVLITRHKDGRIGLATPKGDVMLMEVMALTYGVFVSVLQGAEEQGITEMKLIRNAIKSNKLEDVREKLVEIAVLVKADMEAESND